MKRWTRPLSTRDRDLTGTDRVRRPTGTTLWSLAPPASRSLAGLKPGDRARVGRIVFEMVRSRCWEAGILEGQTVSCRDKVDGGMVVSVGDGPTTLLDEDCARFVEVRPV